MSLTASHSEYSQTIGWVLSKNTIDNHPVILGKCTLVQLVRATSEVRELQFLTRSKQNLSKTAEKRNGIEMRRRDECRRGEEARVLRCGEVERERERDMKNCDDRSPLKAADGSSTEGMDEWQVLMRWMKTCL